MTLAPSVYGPLDDDVALLASDGKVIRRHDGMYRLNGATEKLTAAMVRGMAAEVRNRRLDAATAPRATKAGHGSYPQRPYAERPDKFWRAVGPSESTKLQGPMPNAGDGGETAATRCRPSPFNPDAAPSGRADVGLDSDVPPAATPQTASGPGRSAVTPAPESGARAGTIPAGDTGNAGGSHDTLTPAPEVARPATPAASCPCGRPRGHGGRCWHKRGLDGPAEKRARWKHPPKVCEKCGGPRSYWSAACCLKCHRTAMSAPRVTQENRIQALERKVAALEALLSMEGLR